MPGGAIEFGVGGELAAPPEAVWALICDLERIPEWVDATLGMTHLSQPTAARGVTYSERTRIIGPVVATTHWEITEFDPPRRQVHIGGAKGFGGGVLVLEVAPSGRGAAYTQTVRLTPALGPLTGVARRLLEPRTRAVLRRNVAGLERMLRESSVVPSGSDTTATGGRR